MSYLTTYTLIDRLDTIERMALHPMLIAPGFWYSPLHLPDPAGRFLFRVVFREIAGRPSIARPHGRKWRHSCRGVDVPAAWAGRLVCGYDHRTDDAAAIAWLLAGER